jgi:cell division septal protein FtsQ
MIRRLLAVRWIRILLLAIAATLVAAGAPYAMRMTGGFRITAVEVHGTRYMAAQAVLDVSGIGATATVFDDVEPWRERLLAHPLVRDVQIDRRLPGTIVLTVTEAEPIAYARTPELVAIDGHARALPLATTQYALDLPILAVQSRPASNGRFADRETAELAAALAVLRASDPALLAWVSEAAPALGGGVRLTLRGPTTADALVPTPLTAERLHELRLILADLMARGELESVARIEARYRDQIIVTPRRGIAREQG